MPRSKPTRGFGLLESFLAGKRTRVANRLIPPGLRQDRVLDIGCGTHPVFLLSTDFHDKFGLDRVVNDSMCETLKNDGITLVNCEIDEGGRIPFAEDFFSVVTMLAVIEHIERRELAQLFCEIHRVLKQGGMLVATTPAAWTEGLLSLMARIRLVSPVEIDEHKGSYGPSELHSMLEEAGFKKDHIRHGYFEVFANTWLTAEKSASRES